MDLSARLVWTDPDPSRYHQWRAWAEACGQHHWWGNRVWCRRGYLRCRPLAGRCTSGSEEVVFIRFKGDDSSPDGGDKFVLI